MTPPACFHAHDLSALLICSHYVEPGKSKFECELVLICSNELFGKNVIYLQYLVLGARGFNTRTVFKPNS